ncbi:MAG: ribose-5-phosphate isomerase [Candidatus Yanofskybacteria bacterium RIFCSPLOWO2_02_FULL_47_9b]|uniref:Ribose-5-phosphate isomerase n=1 Tax=Candidatus Yanofskybacteria bacterium RIFCSPLOWO2_02_FULL_47_9b TaxID=1802708 RepID=A0A1F8H941_9BACT|nr:MAG: ribose-5-phosphate isomerase [Candidatus Yanofskybacteria bacterium RIFCSPLOWO2_02_FULL_47_9b]
MKIIIGADHAGYELKEKLKPWLSEAGHEVVDVGAYVLDAEDDYPDFVKPLVEEVLKAPDETRGIFCGGSGQGEALMSNRSKGIRAVVYAHNDMEMVKVIRTDSNSNVLSIGARFVSETEVKQAIGKWLSTPFDSASRHARRLAKIDV